MSKQSFHIKMTSHKRHVIILLLPLLIAATSANRNGGDSGLYVDFAGASETVPNISTSIKELMYADATSQVVMMDAPEPNRFGSAVLDFPFKLPPGRQGMTPQLGLTYNSDGGNSWLGLGWNLDAPSIEVETRWGVPRYSSVNETETYLLDGQQLAPVAHRGQLKPRESERRFYMRVETGFQEIIRHGNNPSNYWWEVTGTDGLKTFYGGLPDQGVQSSAVLTDPNGNIALWGVTRQQDRNGNTIDYTHEVVFDPGVSGGSVLGKNIYVSAIHYTGHAGSQGPFSVHFNRDHAVREDIEIDCKMGLKRVTADRLTSVEVKHLDATVRTYTLDYTEGVFHKTLLASVAEIDSEGEEFYRHSFEYYDDIRSGGDYLPYGQPTDWTVPEDDVKGTIVGGETSVLGSANAKSFSAGGAVTVGPNDFNYFSKINTAGAIYEYSSATGNGLTSLVDIDGDGLPDKVFKKDGKLWYRKNLSAQGMNRFDELFEIDGISDFNTLKSNTNSFGAEAHPGGFYVGYTYSTTKNKVNTYFSDFNGDGLVDVAHNGSVFFNAIDADGRPFFSKSSAATPSPVVSDVDVADGLIEIDPDELEEQIDQFPLHDVVRFWEAPASGTVDVHAPVRLVEDMSQAAQDYGKQDGVRLTIQHNDDELWVREIEWGDFDEITPTGVSSIDVKQGERIYFRVQSVFDGAYDKVIWAPEISYRSEPLDLVNPNGESYFHFKSGEDFVLSSCQAVNLTLDGEISFSGELTKPETSDDLHVLITNTDTFDVSTVVYSEVIPWDSSGTFDISADDIPVDNSDVLEFEVRCNSNVEWSAVRWTPRMIYTESYVDTIEVTDQDGNPLIDFCPAPSFQMYNGRLQLPQLWIAPTDGTVTTRPFTIDALTLGPYGFTIKSNRRKIHSSIHGFGNQVDPVSFDVSNGDTIYFELSSQTFHNLSIDAIALLGTGIDIQLDDQPVEEVRLGVHCTRPDGDIIFGPMYRNWGLVVYNGNRGRADAPIDEEDLNPNEDELEDLADGVEDVEDPDDLEGMPVNDGAKNPYVIMFAEPKHKRWSGTDFLTYISFDTISSSRLGEDDLLPGIGTSSGGDLSSLPIESHVSIHSVAGGGSVISGISVAYGESWATTTNILDVADFNGDQFPDFVSENKVRYTTMTGDRESTFVTHNLSTHIAKSHARGLTLGGEFNDSDAHTTGGTSGSGSNNKTSRSKARTSKSTSKSDGGGDAADATANVGAGINWDDDYAEESWLDVNGDGLVDKVYENGRVRLNVGYGFLPEENWGFASVWAGATEERGLGGGVNLWNGSFALGVSAAESTSTVESGLFDFNSDGLVDMITNVDPLMIRLNNGNGFSTDVIEWKGVAYVNRGRSSGISANTAITICVPILAVKVCMNPNGSIADGMSRQSDQIHDVDGDGFADVLKSDGDGHLQVGRSRIGRSNLLKTVFRPLGGSVEVSYRSAGSSYDLPYAKWVMSEVAISDGLSGDGSDTRRVGVEYSGGMHDRHEREFYGFAEVRIIDLTDSGAHYRYTVREYDTRSYYHQGLLTGSYTYDLTGQTLDEVRYDYDLLDPESGTAIPVALYSSDAGRGFPALSGVTEIYSEGDPSSALEAHMTFTYDEKGNIVEYVHRGNGTPEDQMQIESSYAQLPDLGVYNILEQKRISDGTGKLLRDEVFDLDAKGNVEKRTRRLNSSDLAEYEYTYDMYGNVLRELRPPNHMGDRMETVFAYDGALNTYVVSTSDTYGYITSAEYDPVFGQVISTTNENGNTWEYEYDLRGRLVTERGPTEVSGQIDYLRRYQYDIDSPVAMGICAHRDPEHDQDLVTYAFYDGKGRQVQTKTPVEIHSGASNGRLAMRVSGKTSYDPYDRIASQGLPFEEGAGPQNMAYSTNAPTGGQATFTYDVKDRILQHVDHDGSTQTYAYDMMVESGGQLLRATHETSPLGRVTTTLRDARDRLAGYVLAGASGATTTQIEYNAISELQAVVDHDGDVQTYEYDMDGRVVRETHPDRGETEYVFDMAGNTIQKITPVIRETIGPEASIKYTYDYERVTMIEYPKHFQNLVRLHYGDPGADYNRAGRIWLVEDASGGEELFYGESDEVVKSIRTVLLSETQMQTFVMAYEFDTWNRIKTISYADGEQLEYFYDRGGRLERMHARKESIDYPIIDHIGYDLYGDEVYRKTGNGVIAEFEYDERGRTLTRSKVALPDGQLLTDRMMSYNDANKVVSVNATGLSDALVSPVNYSFEYDDQHRVMSASAMQQGGDQTSFEFSASYNEHYNFDRIELTTSANGQVLPDASFGGGYDYEGPLPNAPSGVRGDKRLYDPNGNLASQYGEGTYTYKQYLWDEEDRLIAVSDNGHVSRYTYDAFGRRVIKSSYGYQGVFVNGQASGFVQHTDDYTIYVNGLMSVNRRGFVKHYYTENTRVASKNGVGQFDHGFQGGQTLTAGDLDYTRRAQLIRNAVEEFYDAQDLPPGPPTLPWYYAQPEQSGQPIQPGQIQSSGYSIVPPTGWPGPVGRPDTSGPPGPPTWFDDPISRDSIGPGFNYQGNEGFVEINQFFYHRDLFGSTNFVTDQLGAVSYQAEYTPLGNVFMLSSNGSEVRPNLYMDRDSDEESGQIYFSGYYYDPATGLFANPGFGAEVAGLGQYTSFLQTSDIDTALMLDNLLGEADLDMKYMGVAGSTAAPGVVSSDLIGDPNSGGTAITENRGNNEGDDDQKPKKKKSGAKAKVRTKAIAPVDDPKDVQFKRRDRKKANTKQHGKLKTVNPKQGKQLQEKRLRAQAKKASDLALQKQRNRSFEFAPGDIGSTPGDRRAVRLGGRKYRTPARKFQSRPGRTR